MMSTTKQSNTNLSRAIQLSEVKQRRRWENLLYTRKRVSQLAAEHRSHGLADGRDRCGHGHEGEGWLRGGHLRKQSDVQPRVASEPRDPLG